MKKKGISISTVALVNFFQHPQKITSKRKQERKNWRRLHFRQKKMKNYHPSWLSTNRVYSRSFLQNSWQPSFASDLQKTLHSALKIRNVAELPLSGGPSIFVSLTHTHTHTLPQWHFWSGVSRPSLYQFGNWVQETWGWVNSHISIWRQHKHQLKSPYSLSHFMYVSRIWNSSCVLIFFSTSMCQMF